MIPDWAVITMGFLIVLIGQCLVGWFMLVFSIIMNRSQAGFLAHSGLRLLRSARENAVRAVTARPARPGRKQRQSLACMLGDTVSEFLRPGPAFARLARFAGIQLRLRLLIWARRCLATK